MGAGAVRTILVTGAAGPAGRALGAQFAERGEELGVRAVGVDAAPRAVRGYGVVEPAPYAADPAYESGMRALVERYEPDLVIPTVSDELVRIAHLGESLGLGRRLVLSGAGPTAVAGDKLLSMWSLARHGVAIPASAGAEAFPDAAAAIAWAGGPVVVKPRVLRGGRGVHVVHDPTDPVWGGLDAAWVVQAFAPRTEYSPQVYRSPDTGESVVVVLQKTALEHGEVGNATGAERLPVGAAAAADIADLATRTVEALGLVGPADMDVRRLPDGSPVVLEVNARFGALSASAPELLEAVLARWRG